MTAITGFGAASMALLSHWPPSFNKLDANADGSIAAGEAKTAWQTLPVGNSPRWTKAATVLFNSADSDGSGAVSKDEATAFNQTITSEVKAQILRYQEFLDTADAHHDDATIFASTDTNLDGQVSADELASKLEVARPDHGPQADLAGKLIAKFDTDGDGQLNAGEDAALSDAAADRMARIAAAGYGAKMVKNYLAGLASANDTSGETSDIAA